MIKKGNWQNTARCVDCGHVINPWNIPMVYFPGKTRMGDFCKEHPCPSCGCDGLEVIAARLVGKQMEPWDSES